MMRVAVERFFGLRVAVKDFLADKRLARLSARSVKFYELHLRTLVELPGLPVVMEATGHWCAAYVALRASGGQVKLAHPAQVRAIASACIKTDEIDARVLAHLLRTDLIPEAWAAPQDIGNLRDLPQLCCPFICDQAAAKNRIHVLLAREGLCFQGSDLFGRRGRRWLASLSLRPHVQEVGTRLLQHLEETNHHVEALTERLHELLDADPAIHLLSGPRLACVVTTNAGWSGRRESNP